MIQVVNVIQVWRTSSGPMEIERRLMEEILWGGAIPTPLTQRSTKNDDDDVSLFERKIKFVTNFQGEPDELHENKHNLPATGPFSIATHQEQFGGKQRAIRKLLNEFNSRGCGGPTPPDAWFATMPLPSPRINVGLPYPFIKYQQK